MAGPRPAPHWFVALLGDQLLLRRANIDAALEGLAAYELEPDMLRACGSTGISETARLAALVSGIPERAMNAF
jgi:hypothetical protein